MPKHISLIENSTLRKQLSCWFESQLVHVEIFSVHFAWGSWSRALNFHYCSVSQGTQVWATLVNTIFLRFLPSCFCCSLSSSEGYFICKDVLTLTCSPTPFKKKPLWGVLFLICLLIGYFISFCLCGIGTECWWLKVWISFWPFILGQVLRLLALIPTDQPCHTLSSP